MKNLELLTMVRDNINVSLGHCLRTEFKPEAIHCLYLARLDGLTALVKADYNNRAITTKRLTMLSRARLDTKSKATYHTLMLALNNKKRFVAKCYVFHVKCTDRLLSLIRWVSV